jgi:hypothetical protein
MRRCFFTPFDLLELNGDDPRPERLDHRKARLDALLRRSRADQRAAATTPFDVDVRLVFVDAACVSAQRCRRWRALRSRRPRSRRGCSTVSRRCRIACGFARALGS